VKRIGALSVVLAGCASVLGIPDDVVKGTPGGDDGGSSGADATPPPAPPLNPPPPPTDSGGGDTGPDSPLGAACDPMKDFTAPVLLSGISTADNEGSARFTEDELTIFFDSDRPGTTGLFDLWTATRPSIGAAFGTATQIAGVNSALEEFGPNETTNGLTLFFEQQDKNAVSRLYKSTRAAGGMPFGNVTALASINSNDYTANPFVRGDGSEIWYVSDTGLLTTIDLYHATIGPMGTFVGAKVNNVNTSAEEFAPVVSADGLTLYFGTDATVAGLGGVNVWVATRASKGVDFGAPVLVPNVNTTSDEQPTWISPDDCRLYLASNRPLGAGKQDVWVASRPK